MLTVPTIAAESIEDYAVKVFEAWKLGQKGKDNGVLVVVVPQDRKMRIEVGYGLEGTLTDVTCGRIIRNVMTPRVQDRRLRRRHRGRGRRHSSAQLEGTGTAAGRAGASEAPLRRRPATSTARSAVAERILLGAFIFGIIGLFTVIGVLTPGVGWFLYVFLIPFWAMFPIIIVGVRGDRRAAWHLPRRIPDREDSSGKDGVVHKPRHRR